MPRIQISLLLLITLLAIPAAAQETGPLGFGSSYYAHDMETDRPDFSFIIELGLPTGSNEITVDDVEPELKLLWAYELSEGLAVTGNVNFAAPVESERFFETSSSVTLAYDLSEQVGSYVEYFGFYPNRDADDSTSNHFLNGGFTLAVSETLQFDVLAGFGLNDEADDFFTGVGVSLRI